MMRLAEHARTPIGAQAGCGFQTPGTGTARGRDGEQWDRGVQRARKRAREARSGGPAPRRKRHRAGTSICCEGSETGDVVSRPKPRVSRGNVEAAQLDPGRETKFKATGREARVIANGASATTAKRSTESSRAGGAKDLTRENKNKSGEDDTAWQRKAVRRRDVRRCRSSNGGRREKAPPLVPRCKGTLAAAGGALFPCPGRSSRRRRPPFARPGFPFPYKERFPAGRGRRYRRRGQRGRLSPLCGNTLRTEQRSRSKTGTERLVVPDLYRVERDAKHRRLERIARQGACREPEQAVAREQTAYL
ncbi:hypothetical protein HPB50_008820 [Hyalomma asiaticum]|uniref:Uncharacterized protein n=1 Tax=Hyalomma asiaticum TaxID=266040 RepID=A0ACB7SHU1_HYAAI|nr:hypothetical protein HPB50_008820 [Hyalomma asiaticum]